MKIGQLTNISTMAPIEWCLTYCHFVSEKDKEQYIITERKDFDSKIEKKQLKDFPHLVKLRDEAKSMSYGTKEYWKLRCTYLKKCLDETYSVFERDNCREFYRILSNK